MSVSRLMGAGWIAVLVVQAALGETPGDRDLPSARLESFSPYPIATQGVEGGFLQGSPESAVGAGRREEAKTAAPARLTVGDLGDPQAIEFEGAETISPKELRRALSTDLAYQAAARPSAPLADFLDVLEERLTEGYLHSGFPDARVTVAQRDDRIVAGISEGAWYKQGAIRVVGSEHIDEKALGEWMMTKLPARHWRMVSENQIDVSDDEHGVLWAPNKPALFSRSGKRFIDLAVTHALIRHGFPYAAFKVRLEPKGTDNTADLIVEILNNPLPSKIGSIEIEGLSRDSREALLDFLEVAPGDALNDTLLQRIDDRLRDSCRYWKREVFAEINADTSERYASAPDNDVRLVLKLDEYSHAPPLNEPLTPTDEILRKAAKWLEGYGTRDTDEDIVVVATNPRLGSAPIYGAGGISVDRIIAGPRGEILLDIQGDVDQGWTIDHSIAADPHGVAMIDWHRQDQFRAASRLQLYRDLRLAPEYTEDGAYCLNLGLNYYITAGGANPAWNAEIEPVTIVDLAHRAETSVELEGGRLRLAMRNLLIELDDATGQLIRATITKANGSTVQFELVRNAYKTALAEIERRSSDFASRHDDGNRMLPAFDYVLTLGAMQPQLKHASPWIVGLSTCITRLPIDLSGYTKRLVAERLGLESDKSVHEFYIPLDHTPYMSQSSFANACQFLAIHSAALADLGFERGSWPWTFARELGFSYQVAAWSRELQISNMRKMSHELERLLEENALGPIGYMVYARSPNQDAKWAASVARTGLENLSDEAFLRDVRLLTEGDSGLASLSRAIVEQLWGLPAEEQTEFLAALPDEARGAARQLLEIRHEDPEIESGEAIVKVLVRAWNDSLRERVRAEFERIIAAEGEHSAGAIAEVASEADETPVK